MPRAARIAVVVPCWPVCETTSTYARGRQGETIKAAGKSLGPPAHISGFAKTASARCRGCQRGVETVWFFCSLRCRAAPGLSQLSGGLRHECTLSLFMFFARPFLRPIARVRHPAVSSHGRACVLRHATKHAALPAACAPMRRPGPRPGGQRQATKAKPLAPASPEAVRVTHRMCASDHSCAVYSAGRWRQDCIS